MQVSTGFRPRAGAEARSFRAVRVAVVEMEGAWRIFVDGERLGRFTAQRDALQCALEIARETQNDGRRVEVLNQTAFGEVSRVADRRFV